MQPPVSLVLAFLHMLQNSNVGYSGPNTACSSLLFFVTRQGYGAAKYLLIIKYAKGTFNENLSLLKSSFPWDVQKVISYLHNTWTGTLDTSAITPTLLPILR